MLSEKGPANDGDVENVPVIEDEANLEFVVGFPCNHYRCPGRLTEGGYAGRTAVVCSYCDDVYYVLAESLSTSD